MDTNNIELIVNDHYSTLAQKVKSNDMEGCCETSTEVNVPSFGCNTDLVAQAGINPGDIVLDFGSGPGHDTIQVANATGPEGKVIGIDFSKEMIALSRENAEITGMTNMEFVHAKITEIPLEDEIADVIISNCVVNLVEDKSKVFEEAYRLLKKGGKVVISDMITTGEVAKYKKELMCACIGGATSVEQYIGLLRQSGFRNINHTKIYDGQMNFLEINVPYISVTFTAYKTN